MTDAAIKAQEWLLTVGDLFEETEKVQRQIEVIESIINNAVGRYGSTGRGKTDLIVRQQQREDALLSYSEKQAEYERKYFKYVRYEIIALNLIDRLPNYLYAAILIDRYITRLKWSEIFKIYKDSYGKSQLYKLHAAALDMFSKYLETSEPQAIQEADADIKRIRKKLRQEAAAEKQQVQEVNAC